MKLNTNYQFDITPFNVQLTGISGYLNDNYLAKQTLIDPVNISNYSFNIDSNAASIAADRFYITFKKGSILATNTIELKASAMDNHNTIAIDWFSSENQPIRYYELEHSTNGKDYTLLTRNAASNKQNSNYHFIDNSPDKGDNYYRIKVINSNGTIQHSNIAKLHIYLLESGNIDVYPNPVKAGLSTLHIQGLSIGKYQLLITNSEGKLMMKNRLTHDVLTSTETIFLKKGFIPGVYTLQIINEMNNESYSTEICIE